MKLNRTREEWAEVAKLHHQDDILTRALEDLAILFAEVDRLTAQLSEARAKADDWQAMKDERDAARCGYANLLDDTNGEIKGLRAQLAEREGIARELAETIDPFACACISTGICGEGHRWGYTVNNCAKAQAARALARFHAAENK